MLFRQSGPSSVPWVHVSRTYTNSYKTGHQKELALHLKKALTAQFVYVQRLTWWRQLEMPNQKGVVVLSWKTRRPGYCRVIYFGMHKKRNNQATSWPPPYPHGTGNMSFGVRNHEKETLTFQQTQGAGLNGIYQAILKPTADMTASFSGHLINLWIKQGMTPGVWRSWEARAVSVTGSKLLGK